MPTLRGRVGGGSLLHLRHPVSSQSKSVSLVHVYIFVPNYLMYVGIHYNIHVPMKYKVGGGIRNQASESIDFLGYGDPAFF